MHSLREIDLTTRDKNSLLFLECGVYASQASREVAKPFFISIQGLRIFFTPEILFVTHYVSRPWTGWDRLISAKNSKLFLSWVRDDR
jgi:hypothetical protein